MYRDENGLVQVDENGSINVSNFLNDVEETMKQVDERDIKTGIYHDGYVVTKAGDRVSVMTILGRTGRPDFIEFIPGYTRSDGKVVDDRLSFSFLTDPEDHDLEIGRSYSSYRVTAWREQAHALKYVLLDKGPNTALMVLTNVSVSNYFSEREGLMRFSLNVNFERQWHIVSLTSHNTAMSKAVKALSTLSATHEQIAEHEHTAQVQSHTSRNVRGVRANCAEATFPDDIDDMTY